MKDECQVEVERWGGFGATQVKDAGEEVINALLTWLVFLLPLTFPVFLLRQRNKRKHLSLKLYSLILSRLVRQYNNNHQHVLLFRSTTGKTIEVSFPALVGNLGV